MHLEGLFLISFWQLNDHRVMAGKLNQNAGIERSRFGDALYAHKKGSLDLFRYVGRNADWSPLLEEPEGGDKNLR